MGLLHFHSEIPRIQASVKAEADESAEAAAAQCVEFKFRDHYIKDFPKTLINS